jgi:hypothetical protein
VRILNLAQEWGWIARAPKISKFEEPRKRVRWEPALVIAALIDAMTLQWLRDVSLVAVATEMREDALLSL